MTTEQIKLFELIKRFANETVTGWIAVVYQHEGRAIFAKHPLPQLVDDISRRYLDYCADQLAGGLRSLNDYDEHLAEQFDQMIAIDPTYHPLELLFVIAQLTMSVVASLEIKFAEAPEYKQSMLEDEGVTAEQFAAALYNKDMLAVTAKTAKFLNLFDENAAALKGGNPAFKPRGKYVFNINVQPDW